MLKKINRLKAKAAFKATYNNNNVVSDNEIVLYAGKIKQNEVCPTRVGFVVSKKVSKRAVRRNRIKRLIRENVRLMLKNNEFDVLNKYQSLIFMAKRDLYEEDFESIRNTIVILLKKLAIKNI